ncbi:hypothetical protein MSG28_015226 [Choristoneura fumiferana]|uniref:Uncharacterized protein n=1 Tax=Choristoneura fumiferana TaxID=7141 RepID=A0ACC0KYT3_CHOFU|nr:hypothetical protein MSG28_015226 [Choristoneura fumiferana]
MASSSSAATSCVISGSRRTSVASWSPSCCRSRKSGRSSSGSAASNEVGWGRLKHAPNQDCLTKSVGSYSWGLLELLDFQAPWQCFWLQHVLPSEHLDLHPSHPQWVRELILAVCKLLADQSNQNLVSEYVDCMTLMQQDFGHKEQGRLVLVLEHVDYVRSSVHEELERKEEHWPCDNPNSTQLTAAHATQLNIAHPQLRSSMQLNSTLANKAPSNTLNNTQLAPASAHMTHRLHRTPRRPRPVHSDDRQGCYRPDICCSFLKLLKMTLADVAMGIEHGEQMAVGVERFSSGDRGLASAAISPSPAKMADSLAAMVQGFTGSGFAVSLLDDEGKTYTLMPHAPKGRHGMRNGMGMGSGMGSGMANGMGSGMGSGVDRGMGTGMPPAQRCDSSSQATDGRYASIYKHRVTDIAKQVSSLKWRPRIGKCSVRRPPTRWMDEPRVKVQHCKITPTSPPVQLTEFPPQRAELCPGGPRVDAALTTSGPRVLHEFPSSQYGGEQRAVTEWSTRRPRVATSRAARVTARRQPSRSACCVPTLLVLWYNYPRFHRVKYSCCVIGSVCSPRPSRDPDAFASSLRKYPPSPDRSSEMVERLITYSQGKNCEYTLIYMMTLVPGPPASPVSRYADAPAPYDRTSRTSRHSEYEPEAIRRHRSPEEYPTRERRGYDGECYRPVHSDDRQGCYRPDICCSFLKLLKMTHIPFTR